MINNMGRKMEIDNVLNTVICGDSLQVMKQLPSESVDLIITSPPYNLGVSSGSGVRKALSNGSNWKTCKYSDDMPYEKYLEWQEMCVAEMFRLIKDNGAIFYNNKNRVQNGLLEDRSVIAKKFPLRQIITWKRGGG